MNPYLTFGTLLYSFRKELTYVLVTFLIVLLLPVIAVIVLTNSGISSVSDKLVKYDKETNTVELYYPNGNPFKQIQVVDVWPVKGVITLEFGAIDFPYQPVHSGIDIANPEGKVGDPIIAFMPGEVIYAGETSWGFGKHVIIDHGNNISSIYAHLNTIYVAQNQHVDMGQVIGEEGQTGWATGPHLHFQIDVWGIPVNPMVFLRG